MLEWRAGRRTTSDSFADIAADLTRLIVHRKAQPMSMKQFITDNRERIDRHIKARLGRPLAVLNDKDRRDWIANDESLYRWARSEGVRV